jgi:hypothetical protein
MPQRALKAELLLLLLPAPSASATAGPGGGWLAGGVAAAPEAGALRLKDLLLEQGCPAAAAAAFNLAARALRDCSSASMGPMVSCG